MSNGDWKKARSRLKRSVCINGARKGSWLEARVTDENTVALTVREGTVSTTVILDYYAWEAVNQLKYEVPLEHPTQTEDAVETLTGPGNDYA
jgi:hypothetical protein